MDLGIRGKTALVAASSKGLGKASAVALASEGVNVMITARNEDVLRAAAYDISAAGGSAAYLVEDVTDPGAPERLVRATVEHFGGIDIVVPNAGGPPSMRALDFSDDDLAKAVNDNLTTSIRLIREAVPHMRERKWGRICCIASSSIKEPIATLSLSNTARTALYAWAKTAAKDLFGDGITLNLACPGSHATDRMKEVKTEGPLGDPADFGAVVAFLCSAQANFITGTTLVIDGGRMRSL